MPDGLVAELRERKVFRLALIYAIVAWAVIQAADIIFPALLLPDWAVRLVIVLVILGFPVALALSWMFDLVPGSKRTQDQAQASGDTDSARTRPAAGGRTAVTDPAPRAPTAEAPAPTEPAPPSRATAATTAPATASPASPAAAGPAERSVAVLPFVNMSDDKDNEYFSDGMTEEILNALAKVRELRVASRTSSFALKGTDADVLDLARQLRVAHVVEGSVRKSGTRIRVTAQLISAEDGYHLWSESYDRELEDVFEVQDDIARSIVDALKVELGGTAPDHLVQPETDDIEAYTLYLRGRFFFNRYREEDLQRSLEFYRQALEHDPAYAMAYAGIADTWMQLADDWAPPEEAYPEAKRAAEKAIELAPGLAEAHTALGKVLGWYDWDFDAAELALRRAVGANRRYGDAHWGLGSILPTTGQLDEAIEEMRLAVSIDPLSPVFNYWLSRFLYFRRQLDEAVEEAHRSIALDPASFRPRLILGLCHLLQDEPDEALEAFTDHTVRQVVSGRVFVARAHAAAGRTAEARAILEELEGSDEYVRAEFLAAGWASVGDLDRAFADLERAFQERSAGMIYLHVDPSYDPLRADARYRDMVGRVGLREG